jgi:alkanesulfonate monooxygenase SsuD/methylene tetrahydromethanopterin reductase-like flavin-dependent oxidoreductase (luciferase family)
MEELRVACRFFRDYTAGEEGTLEDASWHNEWIRRSNYHGTHVPVWLAIAGPRTCEIAGEAADAALSIGMDPVLQGWRKEKVEKAARAAGRDPSEIAFYVRTQTYIAESKAAAKRELEPYAATATWELYQILRRVKNPDVVDLRQRIEDRHPGLLEEFKAVFDNYDPYWTERIGGPQTKFVTQRIIDFFLANGTPDDISRQIEALQPLGIAGISSVMFSIERDLDMMKRMSKEIMPRFQ